MIKDKWYVLELVDGAEIRSSRGDHTIAELYCGKETTGAGQHNFTVEECHALYHHIVNLHNGSIT